MPQFLHIHHKPAGEKVKQQPVTFEGFQIGAQYFRQPVQPVYKGITVNVQAVCRQGYTPAV
jgi:hypothetical protein